MPEAYDKYYQTEDLFGSPYPEMIAFFTKLPSKGKVLDLGCGQGRDAIALARMGYSVTGIDNSSVGIKQMNQIAKNEKLDLFGQVGDVHSFEQFDQFDIILLDSMFHFNKKEKEKETSLIKKIVSCLKNNCLLVVCIQDTGEKIKILNEAIDYHKKLKRLADTAFRYRFEDKENKHFSETDYRMIVVEG
ncbi:MAG: class I SAM-dependent methyltransferase [Saprospiraceae bacterium]